MTFWRFIYDNIEHYVCIYLKQQTYTTIWLILENIETEKNNHTYKYNGKQIEIIKIFQIKISWKSIIFYIFWALFRKLGFIYLKYKISTRGDSGKDVNKLPPYMLQKLK